MDDFESELKNSFLEEAEQAIADVEHAFIELEEDPKNQALVDKIFRLAHNLKGSSKAVGFSEMGEFTHHLESFLLGIKDGKTEVTAEVVSILLDCSDQINTMIQGLIKDFDAQFDFAELQSQLTNFSQATVVPNNSLENADANSDNDQNESEQESIEEYPAAESFADTQKFDEQDIEPNMELLRELGALDEIEAFEKRNQHRAIEEVETESDDAAINKIQIPTKNNQEKVAELKFAESESKASGGGGSGASKDKRQFDESIRISLSRLETLVNYVGEMSILQAVLNEQAVDSTPIMTKTVNQMGKVMKEVQDLSMSLRMVPIKPIFLKMQRVVRDTSSTLGKDVGMTVFGEDTEVDKTVLEKISDPLVHLVRNSVDHGIEADRDQLGKDKKGSITLKAFHQGGRLVIEVTDDGAGLDAEALREKAIEKGICSADAVLSQQDCYDLIFHPGLTTKEEVTDISGRGVGMDVVKTNIESMNGEISVESSTGIGTVFRISLPLTLAIIDAMVVSIGHNRFIIPLSHVMESVSPHPKDIKHTTGIGDILLLRGENIPLFRMSKLLNVKAPSDGQVKDLSVIVARVGGSSVAVVVDEIIGQNQIVIKQLGLEAQGFRGISATTILGDGKPALILELAELISPNASQLSNRRIAV